MDDFILVVGTGAMACLLAARLAQSGQAVRMLGTWHAAIDAINARGIRLQALDGSIQSVQVTATRSPADCQGAPLALVLVKSWQTRRAAQQLGECLAGQGMALSLQNGLGNQEQLEQSLGPARVAVGVTTLGATLLAPGEIRFGGPGEILLDGKLANQAWFHRLIHAPIPIHLETDMPRLIWNKLAINAAINPLTALLQVPNGRLLKSTTALTLLQQIIAETVRIGKAQSIEMNEAGLVRTAKEVAGRTSTNYSSMLQDILRGAPTEIEAINGAIIRLGINAGIPTPGNQILYSLIRSKIELAEEPNLP